MNYAKFFRKIFRQASKIASFSFGKVSLTIKNIAGFKKQTILSLLLLIAGTLSIFWQFFLNKLYLFPGNYLLAWFEPYKSENFSGNFISLAHKAVAQDTFRFIYPFKILVMDLVKHGQLPLWNPYNGNGMPLLASINIGYFDPLNILFFVFSNHLSLTLIIIIQTLLIGICTFLYAKSIKLGNKTSFFMAVIFTLSGAVITRIVFVQFTLGIALMPFLLFLLERYRENSQKTYLFILAPAVFVLLVSTHFQYSFYILVFVCFYWIFRHKNKELTNGIGRFIYPFLFILLGLGLASIQLIPAIELFRYANLNAQSSSFIFNSFLLPLNHFVTVLIPNYYGNVATYNYWGVSDYIETAVYIGIIPCLFAFFSILNIKEKKNSSLIKFYLFILVFTILISIKWPFTTWVYGLHIPFLSIGVPTRIFFITTFSLAVLSGFGYEYWHMQKIIKKNFLILLFIFTSFVALIFLVTVLNLNANCPEFVNNCRITSLRNTLLELLGFVSVFILIMAYLLFKFGKRKYKDAIPVIIIFIVYMLGFYNSYKFLPFSPRETFFPKNDLIEAVKRISGNTRVFGIGNANITTDFATSFHFYDPQYTYPIYIKRYGEFISFANTGVFPPPLSRSDVEIVKDASLSSVMEFRRNRLMSFLNVNYFIFKKDEIPVSLTKETIVWENDKWYIAQRKQSLPHAYLVNKLEVVKEEDKELNLLFNSSFDLSTTAVVEQEILGIPQLKEIDKGSMAIIKEYRENNVLIETHSSSDSFLVLSDNFYPGWNAYVDDKEVSIYRTNYTFRGVKIPHGVHIVNFVYNPVSFKIGVLLSVVSGLLYSAAIFILIKKRFLYPRPDSRRR
ncbi:MAG: hypothetical protein COU25_00660 [Candidatus Levybacteria bacterium CG10_big_fil_rev_8_21_14_0_10_35_13]|nr:MAG: hypothetical protein COU25_00660 [Candidatus Levybacteria bacterium CG10_big_fil_rev_8_21_14_0_10_35_13]